MPSEIERAVSAIVETAGVAYRAVYVGECKNAFGGDHTMDQWRCEFVPASAKRAPQYFDFFTGLGLRSKPDASMRMRARLDFPGLSQKDIENRTGYGRRYLARVEKLRKPAEPSPASVLYSLTLDSSAVGQSFESWCGEYGYDTDSRKTHQTYMDCQANADKLARVFAPDVIRQLSEALQEY